MGLFSFFGKNKQDASGEDKGYSSRDDDDAFAAKARSKRASSAGDGAARRGKSGRDDVDPVLPEKKRARRRLVGAIALALAVAVGLPMLLDAEPKRLGADIAIQIPSKDKVAPLPVPARVADSEALDQREQIVDVPPAAKPPVADSAARDVAEVKTPAAPDEPKIVKAPEPKPAGPKPAAKPLPKEDKLAVAAKPANADSDARALAILEGKSGAEPAAVKYVLQVAALATADKVAELQGKLSQAGIKSYTRKVPTKAGELTRVQVGPFGSKEEAEKVRAKLVKLGLNGNLVPA